MFTVEKIYTNYSIEFDDSQVFNMILDNEKVSHENSLESTINKVKGVAQVYWEDTGDLFKDDRGFMYVDIYDDVCHTTTLKTIEKHIARFIEFWEYNKNA